MTPKIDPRTAETDDALDALTARVTRALDVPEPSPLFWEHFPARVRAAVSAEPAPAASAWWRGPLIAGSLSLALCGALAAWVLVPMSSTSQPTSVTTAAPATAADDAGWAIVTAAAEAADVDALREAGFGVDPGGADAALEDLSETERAAFVALLQAELQPGGGDGL